MQCRDPAGDRRIRRRSPEIRPENHCYPCRLPRRPARFGCNSMKRQREQARHSEAGIFLKSCSRSVKMRTRLSLLAGAARKFFMEYWVSSQYLSDSFWRGRAYAGSPATDRSLQGRKSSPPPGPDRPENGSAQGVSSSTEEAAEKEAAAAISERKPYSEAKRRVRCARPPD